MLKIVVAYDGSIQANAALERINWFVRLPIEVVVVTSVPAPAAGIHPSQNVPNDAELLGPRQHLEHALSVLRVKGVEARGQLVIGDSADSVLDTAEAEKADLIITGSRGQSMAKRIFLGSVSTRIAHHATCSVMIVR